MDIVSTQGKCEGEADGGKDAGHGKVDVAWKMLRVMVLDNAKDIHFWAYCKNGTSANENSATPLKGRTKTKIVPTRKITEKILFIWHTWLYDLVFYL